MINKVFHGDCQQLMKNIPDKSIDMILTDIPYGEVTEKGAERAKYSGQLRDTDKQEADVVDFDLNFILDEFYRINNGSIYIFCGIKQLTNIYKYFESKKDYMVRQCGWKKTNPAPVNGQHLWLSSMENCIFAKKRKTLFNQSCKSAIWEYPVGKSKLHPTQKPVQMFQYLIESSTGEGDLILDPFAGSGTTAIACINTNRKYILIEKEQEYIDTINKRISEHTKQLNIA